jgi:hypothetical protein
MDKGANLIRNASDLKYHVEQAGHEPYFFTRREMAFFGDTMRNYGVKETTITDIYGGHVKCYELFRRRAVKHGLKDSAYFDAEKFNRIFPKRGE